MLLDLGRLGYVYIYNVCAVLCGLYLKGKKEMDGQKLERVSYNGPMGTLFSDGHWFNRGGCVMGVIENAKGAQVTLVRRE